MSVRRAPVLMYVACRGAGLGHRPAMIKACRGNWNPYVGDPPPLPTEEELSTFDAMLRAEGIVL